MSAVEEELPPLIASITLLGGLFKMVLAPKKGSPTKKHLWPPSVIAFFKTRNMKRIFGVDLYSLGCWIRRLGLSFIVSRQKDQRGARLTLCTRRWIICAQNFLHSWTLHCNVQNCKARVDLKFVLKLCTAFRFHPQKNLQQMFVPKQWHRNGSPPGGLRTRTHGVWF